MTINRPLLIKYISPIALLAIGFFLKNGLLVELAINWILLLLIEKKGLWVLGLLPTKKNVNPTINWVLHSRYFLRFKLRFANYVFRVGVEH